MVSTVSRNGSCASTLQVGAASLRKAVMLGLAIASVVFGAAVLPSVGTAQSCGGGCGGPQPGQGNTHDTNGSAPGNNGQGAAVGQQKNDPKGNGYGANG
jgi:hypothetical protein